MKWAFFMPFAGLYLEVHDVVSTYLAKATPSLGETHPDILRALVTQAFCGWCNGHYREAINVFKFTYKAYVRTLGPDHEDTRFAAQCISLCGSYVDVDEEVCR
jgi:hypothetical protein